MKNTIYFAADKCGRIFIFDSKPSLNWSDSISDAKRWKSFDVAELFAKSEQHAMVLEIS